MKTDKLTTVVNADEQLYMRMLLMFGPDPEPNVNNLSEGYRIWRNQVLDYLTDLYRMSGVYKIGSPEVPHAMNGFVDWLIREGLHYDHNQPDITFRR